MVISINMIKLKNILLLTLIPLIGFAFLLGSIVVDKVILLYLIILFLIYGLRERFLLNPYLLFILTPITLLASVNIGANYTLDLTHETYILGIINISAFLFSLNFKFNSREIFEKSKVRFLYNPWFNSKWKLKFMAIIFLLISLLGNVIVEIHTLVWFFGLVGLACCFKLKKLWLIIPYIIAVFSLAPELSKTSVVIYLIAIILLGEKYYRKISRKYILPGILVTVSVVLLSFFIANKDRGQLDLNSTIKTYSEQGISWSYSPILFLPYMYLTTPWTNLQYVTLEQDDRTNGLWSIKPIVGYFQLDENFKSQYGIEAFSSFNTFTFIAVHFKDFGYWLSILPTIFLGILVRISYRRFLNYESPFTTALYCVIAFATFQMFFSNHFFMQSYPFTAIILITIFSSIFNLQLKCKNIKAE